MRKVKWRSCLKPCPITTYAVLRLIIIELKKINLCVFVETENELVNFVVGALLCLVEVKGLERMDTL